jgi:Domain of unknown function (DUF5658)
MSNEEQVGDHTVTDIAIGDRRELTERRTLTLRTIFRGSVRARRRSGRRRDDAYHIDWHEPDLLFLSVTMVLLSVIDAFLTLTLLRHGAQEANPVLAYVLTYYPELFASLKMLLTGLGVLVLVAMARARLFRVIRVKTVLQWSLLGYVVLIGYELWLLRGAI